MREDTCFQQAAAFQLIPSKDGVFFETDGRTRFCLCAPKASSLTVSLPGGPSWPLEKGEDGRWRATLEIEGGFRYVDIVMDGETRASAPAAHWFWMLAHHQFSGCAV